MANYTILLIDYEPRSIERFRDPLVGAGYSVELANDGVSGIEAFHRLNPDMVIVEAMIPKKHGFEVCQELKRTPHGRRTPVIITTGVYKGRKYRTQALHIYGCDEYIEKPIAPEQLLEIVGRFLAPGTSSAAPEAAHPMPANPGSGDQQISRTNVDAFARTTPARDKEDGEDEITARLDALLSGKGLASPVSAAPEQATVAAAVDQDFFAPMRAELDAELGAMSSPMAFETAPTLEPILEPLVSDQLESPSVLDVLPVPEMEVSSPVQPPSAPAGFSVAAEPPPGQVVDFETKRSRKGKKTFKQGSKRSPAVAEPAPSASTAETVEAATPAAAEDGPVPVPELAVPRWTMAEAELETKSKRGGVPAWVWAAVGAVALVGIYLVFPRGGSSPSVPAPTPKSPATEVTAATPVATPPAVAIAPPVATLPPAPTPTPVVAATPSGTPSRTSAPSRPAPENPKPVVAAAKVSAPSAKPVTITPSAPSAPETAVAGVETVPDPTAPSTAPRISPGALIPLEAADTLPVAIKRNAPIYSAVARGLRLSGRVIMNVLVNERGTVDQVVLVSAASGADLNESAMAAAKAWTYRPATKNGVPVKVWKSEQVVFMP